MRPRRELKDHTGEEIDLMSLFSFSDNWMDLSRRYPMEFIEEVERRYILDADWKVFIRITKEGHRADKPFDRKGGVVKPGEWIARPIQITELNGC